MRGECTICGVDINDSPQMNEMCIDCFSDKVGELVEISPLVSPELLHGEKLLMKKKKIEEEDMI